MGAGRKRTRRASDRQVSDRFGYTADSAPRITARFLSPQELPDSVKRRLPKESDRVRWMRTYNRTLARVAAQEDSTFEDAKREARRASDEATGLRSPGSG